MRTTVCSAALPPSPASAAPAIPLRVFPRERSGPTASVEAALLPAALRPRITSSSATTVPLCKGAFPSMATPTTTRSRSPWRMPTPLSRIHWALGCPGAPCPRTGKQTRTRLASVIWCRDGGTLTVTSDLLPIPSLSAPHPALRISLFLLLACSAGVPVRPANVAAVTPISTHSCRLTKRPVVGVANTARR